MSGNKLLRERLKYEKDFLEKYFSGETFPIRMKNGVPTFERDVKTSNGNIYRLRIYVGENYPQKLPELVVCGSPKQMPEWEGSHYTHTWQQIYGLLRICFFRPKCWTRENRLHEVFNKGEEWLEAYEKYLVTGEKMCEILPEMEPSEEEIAENAQIAALQMARAAQLMSRLEEEKDLLERYFYPEQFPILRENEEPYFEREVKFKNGYVYKLRVCITEGYPDVLPDLVVSQSPEDQPMPSSPLWSGSHKKETLLRRQNGLLRICHFHPDCWTPDDKIYQVFNKGKKWLKVYVLKHLVRRKPMSFYLKEMELTEEEKMKAERRINPIGNALMSAFAQAASNLDEKINSRRSPAFHRKFPASDEGSRKKEKEFRPAHEQF